MPIENDKHGPWCECAPGEPWLRFIAVVAFDITNGHTIEHAVKAGGDNGESDEEIQCLRMQAMPDCNTTQLGDSFYCFRSRRKPEQKLGSPLEQAYDFGYAFFRQEKDDHYSRGYLQKSVVIVTQLPFVAFYERLVKAIGPLYFEHGHTILQDAVSNMKQWPFPVPGSEESLAFLGYDIKFNVPVIEYPERLMEIYNYPHSQCHFQVPDQLAYHPVNDASLTGSDYSDRLTGNSSHHEQKLLHVVAPNGTNDTREEDGNNTHVQTDRDDSEYVREEIRDISLEDSPMVDLPTWLTDACSLEEEKNEVLRHGLTQNAKRRSSLPNVALSINVDSYNERGKSFTWTGSSCFFSTSDDEETDEEDENGPSSAPEVLEEVLGNDDVETVDLPTLTSNESNNTATSSSPKYSETDSQQNGGLREQQNNRRHLSLNSIMAESIAGHKSCGRSPYAELLLLDETLSKTQQGLFQGIGLYSTFGAGLVEKLWVLWELVMVGEPVLVVAPNVGISSAIILGMVSLVSPLYYCGDFRPHFTTFDVDYPHIVSCHNNMKSMMLNKASGKVGGGGSGSSPQHVQTRRAAGGDRTSSHSPARSRRAESSKGSAATQRSQMDTRNHESLLPAFLLGVINPIMLKTLDLWPNAIILPGVAGRVQTCKNGIPSVSSRNGYTKSMGRRKESSRSSSSSINHHHVPVYSEMRNAVGELCTKLISDSSSLEEVVRNIDGSSAEKGHSTLFITRKPPAMNSREDIIAQLLDPDVPPPRGERQNVPRHQWRDCIRAINDVILRRHFNGLTNRFLKPFQEYFTPLGVPLGRLRRRDSTKMLLNSFHGSRHSSEQSTNLQMYMYDDAKLLMRPFIVKEFLNDLKPPDGYISVNWLSLYERFIRSPNFSPWFRMKRKACREELSAILEGLCLATTPHDLLQLYGRFLRDSSPTLRRDIYKALAKKVGTAIARKEKCAIPDSHMLNVMRSHLSAVQDVLMRGAGNIS